MKSKFQIELPERKPDETNATERQIRYIGHLLDEIDAEDFSLDIESLGKWQASSLINRILEIQAGEYNHRTSVEENAKTRYKNKKRSNLVWYLILAFIICLLWIWLTK